MGSKISNGQSQIASPGEMSQGIATAFGDGPDEAARKRKKQEDEAAQASAMQQGQQAAGQEMSAWDQMQAMAGDVAGGVKDVAGNPGGVWDTLTNPNGQKKKKN